MGTGGGLVVIDFSQPGNSAYFRREGWSGQESDRVWAIGPRSVLRVPVQASGRSLILEAEIGPCRIPPEINGQIVGVRANGHALGWVRLAVRSMIRCEIDAALTREDGMLEIEFEFPGCFHRHLLRDRDDERLLAGWFSFVRIYTTDMFKPGPHFPTSHQDIKVVSLSPPIVDEPAGGRISTTYTFGPDGTGVPYLWAGWRNGNDGFARVAAASARILLPPLAVQCNAVIRLDVRPAVIPSPEEVWFVTVAMDRVVIGQFRLTEPTTWMVYPPRELMVPGNDLELNFISRPGSGSGEFDGRKGGLAISRIAIMALPPAITPATFCHVVRNEYEVPLAVSGAFRANDAGSLPAAIPAAPGTNPTVMSRGFENLLVDPQQGAFQNEIGMDGLNLFRYCDATAADLLCAMTDDLRAVAEPDAIRIEPDSGGARKNVLTVTPYNLKWILSRREHGSVSGMSPGAYARRLGYLRRKFFEGLNGGKKTYIISQRRRVSTDEAVALLLELNRHGQAALLCAEPASPTRREGEVELIMPGLMRGYVDFASSSDWSRMMANATLIRRDQGTGPVS